jgi:UDP-N-acetylmuramyl pentapeptide phosphotransferase/UDP-N-acetylglucosamine-1-phosphate transferase
MPGLLIAFIASLISTLLIIRYQHLRPHLTNDTDLSGPQKFHKVIVPRIGGIGIAIGVSLAIFYRLSSSPDPTTEIMLLLCAIPALAVGLIEDFTKSVNVRTRLFFTGISGMLAV